MDKNKQRMALAEASQGIIEFFDGLWICWIDGARRYICKDNDPLEDLNAINEVKKLLKGKQKSKFAEHLCDILRIDDDYYVPRPEHNDRIYHGNSRVMFEIAFATAGQQSEAFIRTIGKWEN